MIIKALTLRINCRRGYYLLGVFWCFVSYRAAKINQEIVCFQSDDV